MVIGRVRHVRIVIEQNAEWLHVGHVDWPEQWLDVSCKGRGQAISFSSAASGRCGHDDLELRSIDAGCTRSPPLSRPSSACNINSRFAKKIPANSKQGFYPQIGRASCREIV